MVEPRYQHMGWFYLGLSCKSLIETEQLCGDPDQLRTSLNVFSLEAQGSFVLNPTIYVTYTQHSNFRYSVAHGVRITCRCRREKKGIQRYIRVVQIKNDRAK